MENQRETKLEEVFPEKTIEELVEHPPSTDVKTYLRHGRVKVFLQPKEKIDESIEKSKCLLDNLRENKDIMKCVDEIETIKDPREIDDVDYVKDDIMTIYCTKITIILKQPIYLNHTQRVHKISFHYSPFYEDILLIREYFGQYERSAIHTEYFENNVPIEILFGDVFQVKTGKDCNAASENLRASLLENAKGLMEYHFKPMIEEVKSTFGDEDAWFILAYKKCRNDGVRGIQFRFQPHHLEINIEIIKVYHNTDCLFMTCDFDEFSEKKIRKTLVSLTA